MHLIRLHSKPTDRRGKEDVFHAIIRDGFRRVPCFYLLRFVTAPGLRQSRWGLNDFMTPYARALAVKSHLPVLQRVNVSILKKNEKREVLLVMFDSGFVSTSQMLTRRGTSRPMGSPGASIEVFILGTAGLMPIPGRALISVLLRREGELFLFDCGECAQIGLRRLNIRWKNLAGIFLTHIHADHVTGLPGILMLSSQADRTAPLPIYGPPGTRDFIESTRRTLPMHINYQTLVCETNVPGILLQGDGYGVRCFPLSHTKECLAYCLEEDLRPGVFFPDKALQHNVPRGPMWSTLQSGTSVILPNGRTVRPSDVTGSSRKGRKFSFVTDTKVIAGLSDFVRESDLLVCEGMYGDSSADVANLRRHLTASQAAGVALDGNVSQLGLIHYSPDVSKEGLDVLLQEAKRLFPRTFLTKDLQYIGMPNHS